jgi:hypothetical protein
VERRRRRRRSNYYLSRLMTKDDRAELRRAAKVEGLEDEIALLRMRLKKAMVEEGEDLEVLSLGLERLSRAVGVQHKMHPKASDEFWDNFEDVLRRGNEMFFPPGSDEWRYVPGWKDRDAGGRTGEGESETFEAGDEMA